MKIARRALIPALLSALASNAYAGPDTEAVEFYNTRLNHFFVTANAAEARGIDAGTAGPGWVRTGRSFPAWTRKSAAPATAQPVCRFYSTGANSHFYTASAGECSALQSLQASERAAGNARGWGYEGIAFYIQAPTAGACPSGSTALNRVYNNGFTNGEGSNHRFVDDSSLAALMVDRGWTSEGVVMCAPAKASTGGNANLPPTTTSFESIAATWQGPARWKSENDDTDVEATVIEPLTLTIAPDGTVTGSGRGCTFTGMVLEGDGFRSHFRGTVSAAGCTDPAFNGDYKSLHLESFGGNTLLARLKRESGPVEARIDAILLTDATLTPPQPPVPPVDGFAAIEGSWIGTVAWNAEQEGDDDDDDDDSGDDDDNDDDDNDGGDDEDGHEVSVNQPLNLQILAGGSITGTGFGCTFTGTLSPSGNSDDDDLEFSGTVEASGCTEPLFNGTFAEVEVKLKDDGSLKIELKREQGGEEVEIEGRLQRAP